MAVFGSAFAQFVRTWKQESLVLDLMRCRQKHHSLLWKRRTFSTRARMANQSSASSKSTSPPKPLVMTNRSARPGGPPIKVPTSTGSPNRHRAMLDAMNPGERIVLYRSGKHGAFYVFAYGIGAFMLTGTFLWTDMFFREREGVAKPGYFQQIFLIAEAIGVTILATVIILAPTNLIQKVSIIKQASTAASGQSPFLMEFLIKRRLPFLKPDILEATFDKVKISRAVPGQQLAYNSVPFNQRNEFNSDAWQSSKTSTSTNFVSRIMRAIVRDTKRSFTRDQMALVVVQGAGTHKLDLQGASLLDDGALLQEFMKRGDGSSSTSLWRRLVARFG